MCDSVVISPIDGTATSTNLAPRDICISTMDSTTHQTVMSFWHLSCQKFFFFPLRHQTHKLFIYFQLLQTCALRVTRRGRECRRTKKWGCPLDKSPVHHSHIKKKRKKKLPFTLCPGSDGNLNVSRFIRVRVLGLSGGSQRTRENPHKQREDIKKKKSDPEWNQRHAAVSCRIFLQF